MQREDTYIYALPILTDAEKKTLQRCAELLFARAEACHGATRSIDVHVHATLWDLKFSFAFSAAYCGAAFSSRPVGRALPEYERTDLQRHARCVFSDMDHRRTERFDACADVMYSKAAGGPASGFLGDSNASPMVGFRFRF